MINEDIKKSLETNLTRLDGVSIILSKEDDNLHISFTISKSNFLRVLTKQTLKGLKKYGHTIDMCDNAKFNWDEMMLEEIVDAVVYAFKKSNREIIDEEEEKINSNMIKYYGIAE